MANPGEILRRELAARGIGKSAFARLVRDVAGGECGYHNVYRWCLHREFTPENQRRAALALELPPDHFARPDAATARTRATSAVLERFLAGRPVARGLTPEQIEVLRSIRFPRESLRPTVAFFEAVAFALIGAIEPDEIERVAATNAELDRALSGKPPLRRKPQ